MKKPRSGERGLKGSKLSEAYFFGWIGRLIVGPALP